MPGIFGYFLKPNGSPAISENLLQKMVEVLCHNEDYEVETYQGAWFGVGHCGLPLNNRKRLFAKNGKDFLVGFSGFLYNFNGGPQNQCQTNSVEHLYEFIEKHGKEAACHINGSFNLFSINLREKSGFICNDRLGQRQLYYYEDHNIFIFSAEMKAILAYPGFKKEIDPHAVADYFNYTFVLGNKTFFRSIKLLKEGTLLSWHGHNEIDVYTYWRAKYEEDDHRSKSSLIDAYDSLFRQLISERTLGAECVVVPLSGGLDSRFIAGHCKNLGYDPLLFTHGIKGCSDQIIAQKVAGSLNFRKYRFIEINPMWLLDYSAKFVHLTEGMVHLGPCMLLGIAEQYNVEKKTAAFLNGINPICLYSSYSKLRDFENSTLSYEEKLQDLRRSLFGHIYNEEGFYAYFTPEWREYFKSRYLKSISAEFSECLDVSNNYFDQKDFFFIKNRLRRFMNQVDCNRYVWHDHFVMSDPRLIDFYLKLPVTYRLDRNLFKDYLRKKFPAMAGISYQKTGVNLFRKPSPNRNRVLSRTKKTKFYLERLSFGALKFYDSVQYYHFNQWYRTYRSIRDYFEDLLTDSKTLNRGYFDRIGVEKLLKRQKQGGNSFTDISSLASFELFHRIFVDPENSHETLRSKFGLQK